jgi:large subunit ribosomal protein L9
MVNVKPGYGRNYLLPQGKAALATPENVAEMEKRRAELEAKAETELGEARSRTEKLDGLVLNITAKVGPEGKLFGSIGPIDISEAAEAQGVVIERSELRMPDGPIKIAGEHTVGIHVHVDVDTNVVVNVIGEKASEEEVAMAASITADEAPVASESGDESADDVGEAPGEIPGDAAEAADEEVNKDA